MNRTIPQAFYDSMTSKNHALALKCIEKVGAEKSGALKWLVLRGIVEPYWIEALKKSTISVSSEKYDNAALQLLASKTPWEYKSDFFDFLIENASPNFFDLYPFHHASYHGSHEAFDSLERKYKNEKNKDFNYNNISSDGHTPLYLSLSKMHMDTSVSILRRGGLGTFMVSDGNKNISVIKKVFRDSSDFSSIKNFWSTAQDKAKLLDELNRGEKKSPNKKRSKKF